MEFKEVQKGVKKLLKEGRFKHTMGVVQTAECLAEIYGCDVEKARLAALLHDCAKHIDTEKKIQMCREYGFKITTAELSNPSLLHAKCGAIVAEEQFDVTDPEILHAIIVHTTGTDHMSLLDQIIFVADYIEPGRDKAPHLDTLRKEAKENLDLTCYHILEDTISYLRCGKKDAMDETTLKAYQYYKELIESEEKNG